MQVRQLILIREIIPNNIPPIMVHATLRVGYYMVLEASLSFMGVGIPPSIPAWGSMIADGRGILFIAWWVSTIPGIALLVLVLSINLLGERMQEIYNPKGRTTKRIAWLWRRQPAATATGVERHASK